jgi:FMN phosphatase YigB (HAD superfamily)
VKHWSASPPDWALDVGWVKAIIFELGTLYDRRSVQVRMSRRMAARNWRRPAGWLRARRVTRAYRLAQEQLRSGEPSCDLREALIQWTALRTAIDADEVRRLVALWIEDEPPELVFDHRRDGIDQLLPLLEDRGIRRAVFSDHSILASLEAMRLADSFNLVVSALEPEVQRFRPHPLGLQVTAARLATAPSQVLYVGEHPEVDALVARRAGIRCAIVGGGNSLAARRLEYWSVDFAGLVEAFSAGYVPRSVADQLPEGSGLSVDAQTHAIAGYHERDRRGSVRLSR